MVGDKEVEKNDSKVSVPCRGLTCFYVHNEKAEDKDYESFRPLSGSYMFLSYLL